MREVYIRSIAALAHDPEDDVSHVKQELEQRSGKKFRRINRFILLALASVYRLPDIAEVECESSLYLGTQHGCAADSFGMLTQMYREKRIPLPFTFINTSANMAGFYIAQSLGLSGESYTFSQPWGSFEKAFSLAYRGVRSGRNRSALAGSCDEAVFPLEDSRRAMGMGDDEPLLEGGCWMHLTSEPLGACARIRRVCSASSLQEIEEMYRPLGVLERAVVLVDPTVVCGSIRFDTQMMDTVWLADEKEKIIGSAGGKKLIFLLQNSSYTSVVYLCREGLARYTLWIIEKL